MMKTRVYVLNIEDMSAEQADYFLANDVPFVKEAKKQGGEYTLLGFENYFNSYVGVEPIQYHRPDCFIKIVES